MKFLKFLNISFFSAFLSFCLVFRFLNFSEIKKNASQILLDSEIKGVYIKQKLRPLENIIIKIFKDPIGSYKNKSIDREGGLFNSKLSNLIKVEGNYKKWPIYYEALEKNLLIKDVYYADIYFKRADIWFFPGLLVQLPEGDAEKSIYKLADFKKSFPEHFKKYNLIDMRDKRRIGISIIKG